MKKNLLSVLITGVLLLSIAAPNISAEKTSPEVSLYTKNIADISSDTTINPIGKIVKYEEGKNVKPLIMELTKSHNKTLNNEDYEARERRKDDYLSLIASGQEERFTEKFFDFLEENELVYYELGAPKKGQASILSTSASDVSLTTPFGTYDSVNKRYEIWGGFHFTNDNAWFDEAKNWLGIGNPTGNIGGVDTIGINLDGGTNGAALESFFMQPMYSDAPGNFNGGHGGDYSAPQVTNRVGNLSSNSGAMFLFQDKSVGFGLGNDGYAKYANNFGRAAVKLAYSSAFANASGNASTYYKHTYKTTISGITLNSDGSFSISIANGNDSTETLIGYDYAY